jgi:two-component system response regulator PilR (NtrC family)
MHYLESYDWPGNVRELENAIERALALSAGETLTAEDVPSQLLSRVKQPAAGIYLPADGVELEEFLDQIRRQLMSEALDRTNGIQTQAAELLGVTFRSFRYYAKKLGLTGSDSPEDASNESPEAVGDPN